MVRVAGVGVLLTKKAAPKPEKPKKAPTVDEFLQHFGERVGDAIANAYEVNQRALLDPTGDHDSSLCEDVFSLVHIQIEGLRDYVSSSKLKGKSEGNIVFLDGLRTIIRSLYREQNRDRDAFLLNLESCCDAANNFFRMMEHTEDLLSTLRDDYPEVEWDQTRKLSQINSKSRLALFQRDANDLMTSYGNDAVYAVQFASSFVMKTIHQSDIPKNLFSTDWEDVYTHNQVALTIVKTMEDFLHDFHDLLCDDLLVRKVMAVLIQAVVCFYVRCLVKKAERIRREAKKPLSRLMGKDKGFKTPTRALYRMLYDIDAFRSYFRQLAKENPPLKKVVQDELSTLIVISECLSLAINDPETYEVDGLSIVLHKRTGGDPIITRFLLTDIWILGAPGQNQDEIDMKLRLMHAEFSNMSARMQDAPEASKTLPALKGILLDEMLKDFYEERLMKERVFCGSLAHGVKQQVGKLNPRKSTTARRDEQERKDKEKHFEEKPPPMLQRESSVRQLPNFSKRSDRKHKEFLENFQATLTEVLKGHNMGINTSKVDGAARNFVNPLKIYR